MTASRTVSRAAHQQLDRSVVALLTTRIRGYSVESPILGHGLRESVVRCDNLFTIRKKDLGERLGTLVLEELAEVRRCVGAALGIA